MKLYSIREWEKHFEKSDSRKAKSMVWVATPTKHDGLSFKRTMARDDGLELFGAWNIFIQIAAKTEPKERRGYLERDGIPMTSEDISIMVGHDSRPIQSALEYFSSKSIAWLKMEDIDIISSYDSIPTASRQRQDETPATIHNNTEQIQNRTREENKKIVSEIVSGLTAKTNAFKPSRLEFDRECVRLGLDAEQTWMTLELRGWKMANGEQIGSWKRYINKIRVGELQRL